MDMENMKNRLSELPNLQYSDHESMAEHTSFRIGGRAALMVFPATTEELCACVSILEQPLILGAGTNVLAPDEELQRPVICMKERMNGLRRLPGDRIEADAGVSLARLATFAKEQGLTGLEFAHGIPGTVGGGVYMNAGAYGGEVCQVAESVTILLDGALQTVAVDHDTFGYRTSRFEREGLVIVRAVFRLQQGDPETIGRTMRELMERRKQSQPLELPSAGSTFKRPVGGYAAALIDEAGLKGLTVGGAQVSKKHAGFVVNIGGATSADVKQLISDIQQKVKENSGILLEPEVRIW